MPIKKVLSKRKLWEKTWHHVARGKNSPGYFLKNNAGGSQKFKTYAEAKKKKGILNKALRKKYK